jgi:beta-lactamase regulating signal transducer with metallopeptidase domain
MPESVVRTFYYFEVHLLYASIVALAAWALTSIRAGSATTKYWIWVATSVNFVVPLGAIFDTLAASHLRWAAPIGVVGDVGVRLAGSAPVSGALGGVWLLGAAAMLARLASRIRAGRRETALQARPAGVTRRLAQNVPVSFRAGREVPAVDGVLRPHISLPQGIEQLLSPPELDAVLIHEVTHARRRDNLIRLVHEVALCLLWFHPLVWLAGARLALYRELSCDESVVERAHGGDLVSALAKLADPKRGLLLEARASSFMSERLDRLAAGPGRGTQRAASALLAVLFTGIVLAGVLGTVAHTACCFIGKIS